MRYGEIGVSIDELDYVGNNVFSVHLLPDINSQYFIPAHTRYVNVHASLLDKEFLSWVRENNRLYGEDNSFYNDIVDYEFVRGSVIQGGYYHLPKDFFFGNRNYDVEHIYTLEDDIFEGNRYESPYNESEIRGDLVDIELLNLYSTHSLGDTILYGFYVGQGDMLLLITSAKNAYIIDTNIYSNVGLYNEITKIKDILSMNHMDERRIKGLIITHKHADHIRGARQLIESDEFDIEYFIANLDYHHPTSMVRTLLQSAWVNIPQWINLNHPCEIVEGLTKICFRNPDNQTRVAPDINDSSIVMCVRHG